MSATFMNWSTENVLHFLLGSETVMNIFVLCFASISFFFLAKINSQLPV